VAQVGADAVRAATGYPIGGVPPLGHDNELRTFLDQDLLVHDVVWAAAGTPRHVFSVDPRALADATRAQVSDLSA
jgi:prolyl-tRNA editing enzyme YbaK/EbsC (Cys-tRNA(Pro) deacylase)